MEVITYFGPVILNLISCLSFSSFLPFFLSFPLIQVSIVQGTTSGTCVCVCVCACEMESFLVSQWLAIKYREAQVFVGVEPTG